MIIFVSLIQPAMFYRPAYNLLLFLLFPLCIIGQESFPEKCIGSWKGTLYIYKAGTLQDSVKVTLEVNKTANPSAYTWITTYESEQHPMVKDYVLKVKDAEAQTYILEEDEETELLMYGFDNKVYSLFETENTMLSSTYELKQDTLYFEVNSGKQQATGPMVTSFQINYLQKAIFTRNEE